MLETPHFQQTWLPWMRPPLRSRNQSDVKRIFTSRLDRQPFLSLEKALKEMGVPLWAPEILWLNPTLLCDDDFWLITSSLLTDSRKHESCWDVVHSLLECTNVLLPNCEVLQRHKASGCFFWKGSTLLTLFLFSESSVITVFYKGYFFFFLNFVYWFMYFVSVLGLCFECRLFIVAHVLL